MERVPEVVIDDTLERKYLPSMERQEQSKSQKKMDNTEKEAAWRGFSK